MASCLDSIETAPKGIADRVKAIDGCAKKHKKRYEKFYKETPS